MCVVKTPKAVPTSNSAEKDLPVLRNPYLDGIDPITQAKQTGTSALRIDRGSPQKLTIRRPETITYGVNGFTPNARDEQMSRFPGVVGIIGRKRVEEARKRAENGG